MNEQQIKLLKATSKLFGVDFIPKIAEQTSYEEESFTLDAIEQQHATHCEHCTEAAGYTNIVFGCGNPNADIMFIGEAPGEEEDKQGIPFVGAAGQKLNEIISAMEITRDDVYIANVIKVRPENNRTPREDEIELCAPYLEQQIECIKPKVIVALGSPASKHLLQTSVGITRLRGNWGWFNSIPVMPTYHPAYLLRNYTTKTRKEVWSDIQQVLTKVKSLS
ncbi:MAG: uracil-DNA glycosylase [Planctomycetota bacterium]|nr:uracil-DNA glycosylase [Planctomycetota bacterium]